MHGISGGFFTSIHAGIADAIVDDRGRGRLYGAVHVGSMLGGFLSALAVNASVLSEHLEDYFTPWCTSLCAATALTALTMACTPSSPRRNITEGTL